MEQASSPWMTGLPKRASPSWSQPSLAFLLTDAPAFSHVSPDTLFEKACKVALQPHFSEDLQGSQLSWRQYNLHLPPLLKGSHSLPTTQRIICRVFDITCKASLLICKMGKTISYSQGCSGNYIIYSMPRLLHSKWGNPKMTSFLSLPTS